MILTWQCSDHSMINFVKFFLNYKKSQELILILVKEMSVKFHWHGPPLGSAHKHWTLPCVCLAGTLEPLHGREHRAALLWRMCYAAAGHLEILGKCRKEQDLS